MMNAKKLTPWVLIENGTGDVITAHCDCVAGLGETCTHVAALLFKTEAVVRARERTTVTGKPAYWMLPGSVDKVGPKVMIIFTDIPPPLVSFLPLHKFCDGVL